MAYDPALVIQDDAEFTTAPKLRALFYVATEDGRFLPVTPEMLSGAGGSTSDPASAREATLTQVRDGVQALSALLGSTDGLETLLATQATYLDQVEGLLTSLGSNTDGIEGLLAQLGVKDDNVLAKLGAILAALQATLTIQGTVSIGGTVPLPSGAAKDTSLGSILSALQGTLTVNTGNADPATGTRQTTGNTALGSILVALQGTLSTSRAAQVTTSNVLNIAANGTLSDGVNLTGRTLLRLSVGASWTAADLTVQTSPDGTAWADLYDELGNVYTIKAGASRNIYIAPGPLLAANWVRFRSGTPAAAVAQASATTLTTISVSL